MTSTEIVEGELVPDVYEKPAALGLFGTDDPDLVIVKAVGVADALARVIRDRKLYAQINSKEYVTVQGWTLLGSMLGCYPICAWSRQLENGWEARVEVRTRDGALIGAAESECLRSERKWERSDDFQIRSMAQTRATAKALRLPLGFVMELAGFDATPADEMPAEPVAKPKAPPEEKRSKIPAEYQPTAVQKAALKELLAKLGELAPSTDWKAVALRAAGIPSSDYLTATTAEGVIRTLQDHLAELDADTTQRTTSDD